MGSETGMVLYKIMHGLFQLSSPHTHLNTYFFSVQAVLAVRHSPYLFLLCTLGSSLTIPVDTASDLLFLSLEVIHT